MMSKLMKFIKRSPILIPILAIFTILFLSLNNDSTTHLKNFSQSSALKSTSSRLQNSLDINNTLDTQNGNFLPSQKLPVQLPSINSTADLDEGPLFNISSLSNLGKIEKIYLENITADNGIVNSISEIQILDGDRQNIGYYLDKTHSSQDKFANSEIANSYKNLNTVLQDGNTAITSKNVSSTSSLKIGMDSKRQTFDLVINLFEPTYIASLRIFNDFASGSNFKIKFLTSDGLIWENNTPKLSKSNNFENGWDLGEVSGIVSSWEKSKISTNGIKYLAQSFDSSIEKGFTTVYYEGNLSPILEGKAPLDTNLIHVGHMPTNYSAQFDLMAVSDSISMQKIISNKSDVAFFKTLANNNFIKLLGHDLSFPNQPTNTNSIDFHLPEYTPFNGILQTDGDAIVYLNYKEIANLYLSPITDDDLDNLNFEYRFQVIESNVTHWGQWASISAHDIFSNDSDLKKKINNIKTSENLDVKIAIRSWTKDGSLFKDSSKTWLEELYTTQNFVKPIQDYNFQGNDFSVGKFARNQSSLNFMGDVSTIKVSMNPTSPYSREIAISEFKIFDEKAAAIDYSVVSHYYTSIQDRNSKSQISTREDNQISHTILTDGLWDLNQTVKNLNSNLDPSDDLIWQDEYRLANNGKVASKKSENPLLSTAYWDRYKAFPEFIIKLNKPQKIDKIGWMFYTSLGSHFINFEFTNTQGDIFAPTTNDYSTPESSEEDKIDYVSPSGETYKALPYDKQWHFLGESNNSWSDPINPILNSTISPKNLLELPSVLGGRFSIPILGDAIRYSRDNINMIKIFDKDDNEIPWEIFNGDVQLPHSTTELEPALDVQGKLQDSIDKGVEVRDNHGGLPWPAFAYAQTFSRISFDFKFSDNKEHKIKYIAITTPETTVFNTDFSSVFQYNVGNIILYSKNNFFQLNKFDPSNIGAVTKDSSTEMSTLNIGFKDSTRWWQWNYDSAHLVLNVDDYRWKDDSINYKFLIYDESSRKWLSPSILPLSQMANVENIKIRIFRSDNGIFPDGSSYKEVTYLLPGKISTTNSRNVSVKSISFTKSQFSYVGINNQGLLSLPDDLSFDEKLFSISYKVEKANGDIQETTDIPTKLSNGDSVTVVFSALNNSNFLESQSDGIVMNIGPKWNVHLDKVEGLPTSNNINLINSIPNIENYFSLSNLSAGFTGSNGQAKFSSQFIKSLEDLENTSNDFSLLFKISNGVINTFIGLDDIKYIDNVQNDMKITIYLTSLGGQTFSYKNFISASRMELSSFLVSDVTPLEKPTYISESIDSILSLLDNSIAESISVDPFSQNNVYAFDKTNLLELSKSNNFEISLELVPIDSSKLSIFNYYSLNTMPDGIPTGYTGYFTIFGKPGFAFGNENTYLKTKQKEFLTKIFSNSFTGSSSVNETIPFSANTIYVIPKDITRVLDPFGKLDKKWINTMTSLGYDIEVTTDSDKYVIQGDKILSEGIPKSEIFFKSNKSYEIKIYPDLKHSWVSADFSLKVPSFLVSNGIIDQTFIDASSLAPDIPKTVLKLGGYENNILFYGSDGSQNSPLFNWDDFDPLKYDVKFLHLDKDYVIQGDRNWNTFSDYSKTNSNGYISQDDFINLFFNFEEGDRIILQIFNKENAADVDNSKLFRNYSPSYVKYFTVPPMPKKQETNFLPNSAQSSFLFSIDDIAAKTQSFGSNLLWSKVTDGNTVDIYVSRGGSQIIHESFKENTEQVLIKGILEGDEVRVVINRGEFSWWGDDLDSGNNIDTLTKTYITPPPRTSKFISSTDPNRDFSFSVRASGVEEHGTLKFSNINVSDNLIPTGIDPITESPWIVKILIHDKDGLLTDKEFYIPEFTSRNEIKDFSTNLLNIKNGDTYDVYLGSLNNVQFGTPDNFEDELKIQTGILIDGELLYDFFTATNISRNLIPKIEGISGIYNTIHSYFSIYDNNKSYFGPNKIKLNINYSQSGLPDETLDVDHRQPSHPISNGDSLTVILDPNHDKYVIDRDKIIYDGSGEATGDPTDTFINNIVTSGLPLGIGPSVYEKYVYKDIDLFDLIYTQDGYKINATEHFENLSHQILNDNGNMIIEVNAPSWVNEKSFSSDELIDGIEFSKDDTSEDFLPLNSTIRVIFVPNAGYSLYETTTGGDIQIIQTKDLQSKTNNDPIALSNSDIGDIHHVKNHNMLSDYWLKTYIDKDIDVNTLNNLSISFEAVTNNGINKVDLIYDGSKNPERFWIETSADGTYKILYFNLGDISQLITSGAKPEKTRIKYVTNDKNKVIFISENTNSQEFNSYFTLYYITSIVEIPTEWNSPLFSKIEILPDSYANNVKANFDNVKNMFKIPSSKKYYYSATVFDGGGTVQSQIDDIFGWKTNGISANLDWDNVLAQLNQFSLRGFTWVLEANIWNAPDLSIPDSTETDENKIFNTFGAGTNPDEIPSFAVNNDKTRYLTSIKLDINSVVDISSEVLNVFKSSSFKGPVGHINIIGILPLNGMSIDESLSIVLKDKDGVKLTESPDLTSKNAVDWFRDNILPILNNGQTMEFQITPTPNNYLRTPDGTIHRLNYSNSFVVDEVQTLITMSHPLSPTDFVYRTATGGGYDVEFDINSIFGQNWDNVKNNVLFSAELISSTTGNQVGKLDNLDYVEFIKQINEITRKNVFQLHDIINLTISTKNNFVFSTNLSDHISQKYYFEDSFIARKEISFTPFAVNVFTEHTLSNGENVSISNFDKILLPKSIDYYNSIGLDVVIEINGIQYENTASMPVVANTDAVIIRLSPKDTIGSIISLPDGNKIRSWVQSFTIENMKNAITYSEPSKIPIIGTLNKLATIDLSWVNGLNNIIFQYNLLKNGETEWKISDRIPTELENGDKFFVKLAGKDGYIFRDETGTFSKDKTTNTVIVDSLTIEIEKPIFDQKIILYVDDNSNIQLNNMFLDGVDYKALVTYDDGTSKSFNLFPKANFKMEDLIDDTTKSKATFMKIVARPIDENTYFNVKTKNNVLESQSFNLYTTPIDPSDLIVSLSDLKQNPNGNFQLVNKISDELSQYLRIMYSTNNKDFNFDIPTDIIPGTVVFEKISPLSGKAILIMGDTNEFKQDIYPKSSIIDKNIVNSIKDIDFEIIGSNGSSFMQLSQSTIKFISDNNLEVEVNLLNNQTIINKIPFRGINTPVNGKNGDFIRLIVKPKDGFFFIDGSTEKIIDKKIENLSEEKSFNKTLIPIAISGFAAFSSLIASLYFVIIKRKKGGI